VRHLRMVVACLIAVVAVSAIAASGASAGLPEWGTCGAQAGGKYYDSGCIAPLSKSARATQGHYEWSPLTSGKLASSNAGTPEPNSNATFETADGRTITCANLDSQNQLRLNGPKITTEAPLMQWEGCEAGGQECHASDSSQGGEISTTDAWEFGINGEEGSWTGALHFLAGKGGPSPTVGLEWTPIGLHRAFFQQISCKAGEINNLLFGGEKGGEKLTMPITPVNTMSNTFVAALTESHGTQLPTEAEGHPIHGPKALVNAEKWESVGIEGKVEFGPEEGPLELKATP
jgi:hypothetical protein